MAVRSGQAGDRAGIQGSWEKGLKTLWRGLGESIQGKELIKRQTLAFKKKRLKLWFMYDS